MSWTLKDTLLRCHPFEILPSDRPKVEAAARRWANDERLSSREREYIRRMWLSRDEPEEPEPEEVIFVFPDSPGGGDA